MDTLTHTENTSLKYHSGWPRNEVTVNCELAFWKLLSFLNSHADYLYYLLIVFWPSFTPYTVLLYNFKSAGLQQN